MKANLRTPQIAIVLALIAALAVLLVAWLVPLPGIVTGEEQAIATMPQTRLDVNSTEGPFNQAEAAYKNFVGTHDVGAALTAIDSAIADLKANPANSAALDSLKSSEAIVIDYMAQLQAYAATGEAYFAQMKHYDDQLMSWTRSLGANNESLRPFTWPIVYTLVRYPPPIGEKSEFTGVTAADISKTESTLKSLSQGAISADTLAQYVTAIAQVRDAGHSIEYTESLQPQYSSQLTSYDTKLQAVAAEAAGNGSGSKTLLATGANLLIGAAVLAGLVTLFIPRLRARKEAAL